MNNKRKKNVFQNIVLLFFTIIFTLILIEFSLRLFLNDDLRYATAPGQKKWVKGYANFNKEGYRDIDHQLIKEKNTVRIAGLGDSFTFGIGIKNADNLYLTKLDMLLNNPEKKYEVFNRAKIGIGTSQEIEILKKDGLKYKPNIIVLGYFLNDFDDAENIGNINSKYGIKFLRSLKFFIYDTFYSYYFYDRALQKFDEVTGIKQTYPDYLNSILSSKDNIDFNAEYLRQLKQISNDNNATLIVAIIPVIHELKNYPFMEANKYIEEAGRKYNFTVIDLLPYFKDYNENELWVNQYDHHMNELGHDVTARAIYNKMAQSKLVRAKN